jgi:hypothetical protein
MNVVAGFEKQNKPKVSNDQDAEPINQVPNKKEPVISDA